jgi:mRNA interferase MazF
MKQGDIWRIDLDPTVGAEMRKTRPAVIVNDDSLGKLPLKVIVPITDWKDQYSNFPWMVKLEPNEQNGLTKTSSIDCFQIRSVSHERLVEPLGKISMSSLIQVQDAIAKVLGIN